LEGHQLVPIRGDNYGASGTHHKSPYYSARKLSSPYINDMLSPLLTPHLTEHSRPSGDGLFTVVVLRSLVHWTAYLLAQGSDAPSISMTRLTMPSRSAVEIPALLSCRGSTFGLSSMKSVQGLSLASAISSLQSPGERHWSSLPHNSRLKCASWVFKAQVCQFQFITNEEHVGLK
jgi:hypothetical protein